MGSSCRDCFLFSRQETIMLIGTNTLSTPILDKKIKEDMTRYRNEGANEYTIAMDQELAIQGKKFEDSDWEMVWNVPDHPGCRVKIKKEAGKIVSRAEQDDLQDVKDLCEELRMRAGNDPKAAMRKASGRMITKWKMPWIIEQELLARGFPLKAIQQSGDQSDLDRVFEWEYPAFKCVPFTITNKPPMKLFSN